MKIGPVATKQQFEKISEYIRLGLKEGAKLLTGGVPEEPKHGYYIAPTVFYDVKNTMRIAREEIFGPVLCIITYETVDEAVPYSVRRTKPLPLPAALSPATSTSTTPGAT